MQSDNQSNNVQVNFHISPETTPNPATMKFCLQGLKLSLPVAKDDSISGVSNFYEFNNAQEAEASPLASKLFGFPWTNSVLIAPEFVAVTKQDWVDWSILAEPLCGLIKEHLENGYPIIDPPTDSDSETTDESFADPNDSTLVQAIKRTLANEIRPVVALDGGDVAFAKFEDGKLHLHMKGACAGCPSKSITLKEGIETRMRALYPEIKEVLAI
jgi:Fe-S cluster biogenesis protein NfuA